MQRLIRHSHKLGKTFSAPSHAVGTRGDDMEHATPRPTPTRVSGEGEGPEGSAETSPFSVFIFPCMCCRTEGFAGFQASIGHDGSNKLENKHAAAESRTLSCSLLHIE